MSIPLDKTLTMKREVKSKDSTGGLVSTFTDLFSGVDCSIWPASAAVVSEFQRKDMVVSHEVATEIDIGSQLGDQLIIDSVTYNVYGYKPFSNVILGPEVFVTVVNRRK